MAGIGPTGSSPVRPQTPTGGLGKPAAPPTTDAPGATGGTPSGGGGPTIGKDGSAVKGGGKPSELGLPVAKPAAEAKAPSKMEQIDGQIKQLAADKASLEGSKAKAEKLPDGDLKDGVMGAIDKELASIDTQMKGLGKEKALEQNSLNKASLEDSKTKASKMPDGPMKGMTMSMIDSELSAVAEQRKALEAN